MFTNLMIFFYASGNFILLFDFFLLLMIDRDDNIICTRRSLIQTRFDCVRMQKLKFGDEDRFENVDIYRAFEPAPLVILL